MNPTALESRGAEPSTPEAASASSVALAPRLLISAISCGPDRGSEPGVGWNHALECSRDFATWVITTEEFSHAIRQRMYEQKIPNLKFVFVPHSKLAKLLARAPLTSYLRYNLWQRRALAEARRLHAEVDFHIVHHLTFCGYREPGYLWRLGPRFVWGPVGGTQNFPWRFLGEAGMQGAISESLRNIVNWLQLRLSPRVRAAARQADVLLTANSTIQRHFQRALGVDSIRMSDTAVVSVVRRTPRETPDEEFRILWIGNLLGFKGLSLLLAALRQFSPGRPWELSVVGSGRQEGRFRRLAQRYGILDRVKFLGQTTHTDAMRQYEAADVFAFTSLRDTSGSVILEALSRGAPVVCLDHQGARDIVNESCGIKIPVSTPAEVKRQLTAALVRLAADEPFRRQLSAGALQRAEEYLWSRRGSQFAEHYRGLVSNSMAAAAPAQEAGR